MLLAACQSKKGRGMQTRHAAVGGVNTPAVANTKPPARPTPPPAPPRPQTGPLGKNTSYRSVSTAAPVLALTFDDGPHATHTPRLLDILRSHQVRATFFVTGQNARRYPAILRRMVAEGHEVANHTLTHGKITKMSRSEVRNEIVAAHQAVQAATGRPPRVFRPPYGATTPELNSWIKAEFGMPSILWSVDPEDWKKPGVGVVTSRLVNGASRGGILLLHDIHSPSVDATPGTISQLKAKGYQFVTVSQLISMEP